MKIATTTKVRTLTILFDVLQSLLSCIIADMVNRDVHRVLLNKTKIGIRHVHSAFPSRKWLRVVQIRSSRTL